MAGTNPRLAHDSGAGTNREYTVLGRQYLTRQAMTLLNLAKTTRDPKVAAGLLDKAADLKSKVDESTLPDQSPPAPDIEPPAVR